LAEDPDERAKSYSARTRAVHLGRDLQTQHGFINMPAFRGSTVLFPSMDDLLARRARFRYGSKGTPTTDALETAWSDLAGAAGTVLVPSGSAACALALMSCLSAGDHALVTDTVYRPTREFCDQMLKRYGVEVSYYNPLLGSNIARLMKPNTKVVYAEAPGSLTLEMQDIPSLAAVAHERGASLLMDNTWATPFFFPAHERGVDIAIEAGTKYLSGHSDLLLGLVSANESHFQRLRRTFDLMSISAGPDDVFLALRGLRTMHLRLREQESAAIAIARWLETRPEVHKVLHPALPSFDGHKIWKRDFLGASGLFSIILNPVPRQAVAAMLDGLHLFGMGFSWGGFESLIVPFDGGSDRTVTTFDPGGPCLRLQIGLEDIADLKADLEAGFSRLNLLAA
jgi:cysteine-S-conjugate beta-lyase